MAAELMRKSRRRISPGLLQRYFRRGYRDPKRLTIIQPCPCCTCCSGTNNCTSLISVWTPIGTNCAGGQFIIPLTCYKRGTGPCPEYLSTLEFIFSLYWYGCGATSCGGYACIWLTCLGTDPAHVYYAVNFGTCPGCCPSGAVQGPKLTKCNPFYFDTGGVPIACGLLCTRASVIVMEGG